MPSTDSLPSEGTLTLTGVWLHDPQSPDTTVRQYLYGKATRSTTIEPTSATLHYAGRRYPVVDYGETQMDVFDLTINIPHGADWITQMADLQEFAQLRRTVMFRDNRGRRVFGHLGGYAERDQDWGTSVSLTFTRVDYEESVV